MAGPADRTGLDRRDTSVQAGDLRERLERLPAGHPSSPRETDLLPRRPVPGLSDLDADADEPIPAIPSGRADRVGDRHEDRDAGRDAHRDADLDGSHAGTADQVPLTKAEWDEHVADVRSALADAVAAKRATNWQHTIDADRQEWSPERNRVQGEIVADLYGRARDVPCDGQAIIAGGLGGAGKSTVLSSHVGIDLSQYLTINPDIIKEEMARRGLIPDVEGLSPMEASELVHEESSAVAKQLARKALADGRNVIWDITMSSRESTGERIDGLRAVGYSVAGIFVDIPVETSVLRAEARHRMGQEDYRAGMGLGGRYVPAEVIRVQADEDWGSLNRKTFEAVRHQFDRWSRYDNSVDGRPPVLADSSQPDDDREERI
ncbi:MAG: zeta toxin family protein [Streptosporangiaceae bacterium]